jgi:hypothetical protein
MKYFLAITFLSLTVAGCLSTPHSNETASNADIEETATYTTSSGKAISGGSATENQLTEEATSESKPMVITVSPPMAPVLTVVPLEGWQSFTSATLGIAVDYPSDWWATEQANGVTFTSSKGAEIQLQAIKINGNNSDSEIRNQQCVTLINSYGVSVDTCVDTGTEIYSAKLNLESNNGLLLSTTGKDALDVYLQMVDSLHLTQ